MNIQSSENLSFRGSIVQDSTPQQPASCQEASFSSTRRSSIQDVSASVLMCMSTTADAVGVILASSVKLP